MPIPNENPVAVVKAADLASSESLPASAVLNPEGVKTPVVPPVETVIATVPAPAAIGVEVAVSHRAALIAKKREAGLSKDQAEAAADAQIAHDKVLAANIPKGKTEPITERQKDVMIRELLSLSLAASDDEVKSTFAIVAKEFSRR